MVRILRTGVCMFTCPVCYSQESHEELVDEVFRVDGRYALVGGTPAVRQSKIGHSNRTHRICPLL